MYFVNPWVDGLVMGGLSLLLFPLMALLGQWTPLDGPMLAVSSFLVWVINWPHFSATLYRLYSREENWSQFPMTALLSPILVLFGVMASFQAPILVAPAFVTLFMIWSPFHFSRQNAGLTLLYAHRAGFRFRRFEVRLLNAFVILTFVYGSFRSMTSFQNREFWGFVYQSISIPVWALLVAKGLLIAVGGGLLGSLAWFWLREQRRVPWILVVPPASQVLWFVFGSSQPAFYFFVPAFHSLQYLLVAWMAELSEESLSVHAHRPWVLATSLRWFLANVLGGVFLFYVLPDWASRGWGIPVGLATAVVLAGVQIHHFIVDGVIWKLRQPNSRRSMTSQLATLSQWRLLERGAV
jgi:hypothetical protein